jgi:hypothetical protein
MSEVRFPNYKITSKSFEGGIKINSDGSFNTDAGSSYDFAVDDIIYTSIDSSGLKTDNISELTLNNGILIEGVLIKNSGITLINNITEFSTDGTLSGNSDNVIPTEKAIKTYVDSTVGGVDIWDRIGNNIKPDNPSGILNIDNIIEETTSSGVTFSTVTKINGGLQDSDVTSTIFLGDSSNTSLDSTFISTSIIGAINENKNIFIDVVDPSGFINTTDQTSSFDNGTRTFQIIPTGSNYIYYVSGQKIVISSTKNIIIDNTEGTHIIYFDSSGNLQKIANPSSTQISSIIRNQCIVAFLYWDVTNSKQIYFSGNNEYHGINMSGDTHSYLHLTQGTRFISGSALNTLSVDQNGSDNSHAQFGIDSGKIKDEDLTVSLSSIASTTGLRVYYLSGSTPVWRRASATTFPIITTGTGRAAYNLDTAGTWSLAEVTNNQFVLVHVYSVNDSTYPYIVILGQSDYLTLSNARTGATNEINDLITTGLPFAEFVPIATVIFQTSNSYSNSVKSRIRSTGTGDNYVDWRFSEISPSSTPSTHGNLSGLNDDDHPQYALLTGRSGDSLKIDSINEFTASSGISLSNYTKLTANINFLYEMSASISNVTGDGTIYTCVFNTEIEQIGSSFDGTTFTAPVDGIYTFWFLCSCLGLVSNYTFAILYIDTSIYKRPVRAITSDTHTFNVSRTVKLTSSSTITFKVCVQNYLKNVGVLAKCSGRLITML